MALPLPSSLSPSKVASFKDCGLAFKFAAIDRLPEPPSPWSTKGTLVHRALELLYCEPAEQRSLEVALAGLGRAREELRVSGARLRDISELSGADALTPAEERIARLAADGMSNKEIAQHLFVTVGTVQTTLVHVYRKLGIAGRKEIAAAIRA